mgnify:CR=1 FL=1
MLYHGDVRPTLGAYQYDETEGVWVARLRERDVETPCGRECCGIEEYACEAFTTEAEARAALGLDYVRRDVFPAIPVYRVREGESGLGGSIDWHAQGGGFVSHWGVSGALEFSDRGYAVAAADHIRALGHRAEVYQHNAPGRAMDWTEQGGPSHAR